MLNKDIKAFNIIEAIKLVRYKGNVIYICGNGGSASTANHFANDLVKMCGIKAISLCANEAVVMAYANDMGYEKIFSEQLKVFFEDGDLLLTISGSGTSKNIVMAQEYITSLDGEVMSFPTMKDFHYDMQDIEDAHLNLVHYIIKKLCQK